MITKINNRIEFLIKQLENMKVENNSEDILNKLKDVKLDLESFHDKYHEFQEYIQAGITFLSDK